MCVCVCVTLKPKFGDVFIQQFLVIKQIYLIMFWKKIEILETNTENDIMSSWLS